MKKDEDQVILNKINDTFEKIGISETEFQQQMMHYFHDESKAGELMNITQQTALEASAEQKPLTKEVALEAFKRVNELQLESMDELTSAAQSAQNQDLSFEDQQAEMNKMTIL